MPSRVVLTTLVSLIACTRTPTPLDAGWDARGACLGEDGVLSDERLPEWIQSPQLIRTADELLVVTASTWTLNPNCSSPIRELAPRQSFLVEDDLERLFHRVDPAQSLVAIPRDGGAERTLPLVGPAGFTSVQLAGAALGSGVVWEMTHSCCASSGPSWRSVFSAIERASGTTREVLSREGEFCRVVPASHGKPLVRCGQRLERLERIDPETGVSTLLSEALSDGPWVGAQEYAFAEQGTLFRGPVDGAATASTDLAAQEVTRIQFAGTELLATASLDGGRFVVRLEQDGGITPLAALEPTEESFTVDARAVFAAGLSDLRCERFVMHPIEGLLCQAWSTRVRLRRIER